MLKIFFDASVIFSACESKRGGSAKLVELARNGFLIGITSQTVIEEVERNYEKFTSSPISIPAFIKENKFFVRSEITPEEIKAYQNLIEDKDAHVVAGAILTKSDYLGTLDKRHLNNPRVRITFARLKIVSPKGLLAVLAK